MLKIKFQKKKKIEKEIRIILFLWGNGGKNY